VIKSGIYCIKNLINNKKYIGSSNDINLRKYNHFYKLKNQNHANCYLQFAYNKHGETNFSFQILEIVKNINKLTEREQYWMDYYNSTNRESGYNIIPEANNKKHSIESINKMKNSYYHTHMEGKNNPFYGKHHTEKTKKLIGRASSKKVLTREFKIQLLKNSNIACYKPLIQLDKNKNEIKKHKSINHAAHFLFPNFTYNEITYMRKGTSIGRVCNGKSKTAFGFYWKFL